MDYSKHSPVMPAFERASLAESEGLLFVCCLQFDPSIMTSIHHDSVGIGSNQWNSNTDLAKVDVSMLLPPLVHDLGTRSPSCPSFAVGMKVLYLGSKCCLREVSNADEALCDLPGEVRDDL